MAKTIIKRKIYDTETALKIAEWNNNESWNSPTRLEEELYKKKNGEYFIYIKGGAGTKYAFDVNGYECVGKKSGWSINPAKETDTLEWLITKSQDYCFLFETDENGEMFSFENLFPDITE